MSRTIRMGLLLSILVLRPSYPVQAQALGVPDRSRPGDHMIQEYLARTALQLDQQFPPAGLTAEAWLKDRPRLKQEFLSMLGLSPLPEKNPLKATTTGTLEGDGFVVENVHYQSRPGLYVTGNLYRPKAVDAGKRYPTIFYVCGHSGMGRDGNKTAFMPHGIWFARHGYICLIVDTLQLGEIPGIHHGTYRESRWWWHSRGYTSAGVECWNGVRGIDYLVSRPDVDPDRIGVTGISGGGAATFWIAAADDRVKVAVPVSGMADLESYVGNRVVNGHCDCMFLYNASLWSWTQIAALIAPRPMLFVNSDQDAIFPMDANQRVIGRLERFYSLFGAGDRVDAVVSMGGHAYRKDIRQAVYRFFNTHFKNDPRPVEDSETDAVPEAGEGRRWPIEPSKLRVFKTDADLPADALNGTIDRSFVPMATNTVPESSEFEARKARVIGELQRLSYASFPGRIAPALPKSDNQSGIVPLETEPGIFATLRSVSKPGNPPERIVLIVADRENDGSDAFKSEIKATDAVYVIQTRGTNTARWTRKNPPNYVERSHVLIGRTVDSGRVLDVVATARYLKGLYEPNVPLVVAGEHSAGVIGAYSALIEPSIAGVIAFDPPSSHMRDDAPAFLNVLRVLDIPDAFGLLAPRTLTIKSPERKTAEKIEAYYKAANAQGQFHSR